MKDISLKSRKPTANHFLAYESLISRRSRLNSGVVWPPISFLIRPIYLSTLAPLVSSKSLVVSRLGTQFRLSPHEARKENFEISFSTFALWQCSQLGCLSSVGLRISTEVISWQSPQRYS